MVTPPSIIITCPVIKEPASDAKRIAAPTTSSGKPILLRGAFFSTLFNNSGLSQSSFEKSVFIIPGHKPFTFMLNFPNSTARLLIIPISAVLEIEYAPRFSTPCKPAMDDTIIIVPLLFFLR